MVNVLLESYDLTAPYLVDALRPYIKPEHQVAIVAFSFLPEQASNLEEWLGLYGKEKGMFYNWLVEPFEAFGVQEENITFVNYFTDTKETAAQKVKQADILYFTGGLPDAMMDRLAEFELLDILAAFDGVVLGCSAGAMIQLEEYHITPDQDYPNFGYYKGLPWLKDFCLEVHFEDSEVQNTSISKVLQERQKPLYATRHNNAAIIVDNGKIRLLGDVRTYGRIKLQRFDKKDAPAAIKIFCNDQVKKTYMLPDLTEESAQKLFDRMYDISWMDDRFLRGLYLQGELIGFINDPEIVDKSIELGWVVHPDYHNQGYATEGVRLAIEELFSKGYQEITAGAFVENPASLRVMEKSGMHKIEKTEEIEYRGKVHHCVFYAIRRDDQ